MSRERKQALQKALSDADDSVRQAAASSLDSLEARESLEVLLTQLIGGDRGQQIAAVYALELISSPKVFLPLIEALKSPDSDIRAAVAQVLASKRHPKTLGPLVKALPDPEPGVQVEIIKALARFSDRRVPACLKPLVKKTDEVALAAIEALGTLGFAEGEAALIQALSDERPRIRRAAAEALGQLQS